jgi:hypothetical protein
VEKRGGIFSPRARRFLAKKMETTYALANPRPSCLGTAPAQAACRKNRYAALSQTWLLVTHCTIWTRFYHTPGVPRVRCGVREKERNAHAVAPALGISCNWVASRRGARVVRSRTSRARPRHTSLESRHCVFRRARRPCGWLRLPLPCAK